MNFFARSRYDYAFSTDHIEERSTFENPNVPLSSPQMIEYLGIEKTQAGVHVDEYVGVNYSAVFSCVLVVSDTLATLPLQVFRRTKAGRELAPEHPVYELLHLQPNPENSSVELVSTLQANALLWGNGFGRLGFNRGGRINSLWPLLSARMKKRRRNGLVVYDYTLEDGSIETLPADEVLHVPALTYNGWLGISPIRALANTIGLGVAAESYGSRFFSNDARPGVVLEMPGVLTQQRRNELLSDVQGKYAGLGNKHKMMILETGAKLHEVGIPPEDAQFIETRKLQRSEICGGYRVPPHMIGDMDKATFSNIEHQDIAFAKHCIRPWARRWEQELTRKIFRGTDYYAEFNLDGLMRGDFKSRMEGFQIGVNGGWLEPNEVRAFENLPPRDGLSRTIMPINMAPVGKDGLPILPNQQGAANDEKPGTQTPNA